MKGEETKNALSTHPCYNEEAHKTYARMHLPVAPRCNIQCNYCNRKYDCSNESRPGVTSEVLTPLQAVEKIRVVKERIPTLKVIGIAGPGDPLANEETFETLELVKNEFPELTLCVSTNGLILAENAQRLYGLGVRFLTMTMNAIDPDIGKDIYGHVTFNEKIYSGYEGAEILLKNQLKGIEECIKLGMIVKINIVMIPGINDSHIPELVRKVKEMGVYIVNILPLIPVDGTKFSDSRAPTPEERKELMDLCSLDAKMMRHCRQCRADAIGLLGNDVSGEFTKFGSCRAGCGPSSNGIEPLMISKNDRNRVAVATSDGMNIDRGFGNTERYDIFLVKNGELSFIETVNMSIDVPVAGIEHKEHISNIINRLGDCGTVIVKEIGPLPTGMLSQNGKKVYITSERIEDIDLSAID